MAYGLQFREQLPQVVADELDGLVATLNADIATAAAAEATTDASELTSGTLPDGRFPATLPAASGANLTALNATQLTTGKVPDARLNGVTTDGSARVQQIAFAASQSASSDVNTLDDYEEGTYTPTWTGSGGDPAIGNGTLSGRYVKVGQMVQFSIHVLMGGTTTFGSGDYTLSLPFAMGAAEGSFAASLKDTGTSFYVAVAYPASTTTMQLHVTGANLVGAGAPFTFASGDWIRIGGTYRAAS